MCSQDCCKQQFVPRQKRVGPYKLINAFTQPPSLLQITTLILFLTQLTLHSIFIVPPLDDIKKQILWVLLGFNYSLLIVIGYDYIQLTTLDPVDRLIGNQELVARFKSDDVTFCVLCDSYVQSHSNHCFRCNRCSQNFDHHCKFLNNCIGGRNYQYFFRLLCIQTLYNFNVIGQSSWVLKQNFADSAIAFEGNQWGVLALLILTVLITILVGGLLAFHFYISLCQMTTTLEFNYPEKIKRVHTSPAPNITVNIWETPVSANRLSNNQRKHIF